MASFTAGTTFVDGVSNDVTAAKLGALVTNATPTSGFIQDRTQEAIIATNDTLLIGDTSDSSNLKRMTVANFAETLPTAKVTTGTIATGTFGTTTSTAATITTGTIPTLTTGTTTSTNEVVTNGTITNLSATTSTFLGTITGSTNVVNIGSGQIYKDASGNVGIGITSPQQLLAVGNGTDQIGAGISGAVSTLYLGTPSNASGGIKRISYDRTNGNLNFIGGTVASSSTQVTLDSSGNVGIAGGAVYITRASADYNVIALANTSGVEVQLNANGNAEGNLRTVTNHPLSFTTNNIERLRIDSSGNCSIGTATALSTLHVHGNVTLSNTTTATSAGTGGLSKPATYAGYLTVSINGTSRKIPYYAT